MSVITWPPSTMSTAGSVTVEPISPASLSTVRTSSTDALSCLQPQRSIAYTKELSLPGASLSWELVLLAGLVRHHLGQHGVGSRPRRPGSPTGAPLTAGNSAEGGRAHRRQRISDVRAIRSARPDRVT